jgi:predicted flavoprotein YhiN
MHFDVAILGAGAAGMMAAVAAGEASLDAETGRSKLRIGIFEKNSQAGVKVLVCGGGRCNFTNAGSVDFLISQFGRNGRFLTPALRHLDNDGLRAWFAQRRVPSHEEHDGKIYPDSNQARSVVNALVNRMRGLGVEIFTGAAGAVKEVRRASIDELPIEGSSSIHSRGRLCHNAFEFFTADGATHSAGTLLLAMGGMSYQRMGTTGDGYRIAQSLGHGLVTPRPAIVGLIVSEVWKELQGLAVPDVEVRIAVSGVLPKLATGKPTPSVNDMLFTHFGLSGPAVLNLSEIVAELLEKFPGGVALKIDFARRHSHERLHALFRDWQQKHGKKLVRKMLSRNTPDIVISSTSPDQTAIMQDSDDTRHDFAIPRRLAEKVCDLESIGYDQACASLTAAQIHRLVERLKNCTFTVTATRGFKEAMVTAGGIPLTEVNPNTYESKIVPNLFVTGEVLDLTGPSGGYNLQLAFSTGHLAGTTIAARHGESP